MHALIEDVLPYLVVLYLVDSLVVVRAAEWALVAPWRRFRLERSGLHVVGLSPLARVFGLFVPGALLTERGLVLLDSASAPGEARLVPFEAMEGLAVDGKSVRWRGGRVATPAATAARRLHGRLQVLRETVPAQRPARLREALRAGDDLETARRRTAVAARFGRFLRLTGVLAFVLTFGLLPASVTIEGAPGPGLVVAALAATHVASLGFSWRLLARAGLPAGEALSTMLLFPPSSIHAQSHVDRDLYVDLDPMAAAAGALDADTFAHTARRLVHRLEIVEALGEDAASGARAQRAAWREVLAAAGTRFERVAAAPPSSDPSAALYCPLCASEYRAGFSTCSDCRIALRSLEGRGAGTAMLAQA